MGQWAGDELFQKIRGELGGLPFFAEDLGFITSDVVALRDRHEIPGMAVLQFAFGDVGATPICPIVCRKIE
jgi:4-alpha-glucanotransferase